MAAATHMARNDSSSGSMSSTNGMIPLTPTVSGGGILANAHEAPKKSIKVADNSFASAIKAAFIPQQAGKMMKTNGKPLGKSFRRTSPLPTHGHEGGEVLKRDPRGQNAPCGDGIVLQSEEDDDEEETLAGTTVSEDDGGSSGGGAWSLLGAVTSRDTLTSTTTDGQSTDSQWDGKSRGRSDTTASSGVSSTLSGVSSTMSRSSSTNPCSIKFAPLPSSGRLKRANSITIGVAARSHLLQSQGPARDNSAYWQAPPNPRQNTTPQNASPLNKANQSNEKRASNSDDKMTAVTRHDDTIDLGEELKRGAMKAWRLMRKGNNSNNGNLVEGGKVGGASPTKNEVETLAKETTGDRTPGRAQSPSTYAATDHIKDEMEEGDGNRTPRSSMHMPRRMSTGAFTGNQSLSEVEDRRKRDARGEDEEGREESAAFLQKLGRTHAPTVANHTTKEKWHPGMLNKEIKNDGHDKELSVIHIDDGEAKQETFHEANDSTDEDEESREAKRLAEEAMASHSDKATNAGAVEKVERKQK